MTMMDLHAAERFREAIAARLGLHFDSARLDFLAEVLERRLAVRGRSSTDYLDQLFQGEEGSERGALARELTVPETFFFRHSEQFDAFREVALPARLRARSAERTLRILSAGCASGEEAYSLAILIREAVPDPSWRIDIRAVDLNPCMLDKARAGRFSDWSLRATPEDLRERWFRRHGREFLIDESIRRAVTFEERNLIEGDPALWSAESYDIVFCRNALMYLTGETMRRVVAHIAGALTPGGYLFLGHAESLRDISQAFALCSSHGSFYYRLGDQSDRRPAKSERSTPAACMGNDSRSDHHASNDNWVAAIARSAKYIGQLAERAPLDIAANSTSGTDRMVKEIQRLLLEERFEEALNRMLSCIAARPEDKALRLHNAVLLTYCGRFGEARAAAHDLLRGGQAEAGARYVLALCHEKAGDLTAAAEQYRAASRADASFAMPRVHLGLLAQQAGNRAAMRREMSQALLLLRREETVRLIWFGGGFTRQALMELCEAALRSAGAA